jgi:hypothetical protein
MGGVHHQSIHPGFDEQLHTLFSALTYAHRRAHAQFALGITRRIRKVGLFSDVFHREEAAQLKNTDIVQELNLPPVKIHCSVLAEDAIKSAIADYRKKQAATRGE